jgi:hypothetical protein
MALKALRSLSTIDNWSEAVSDLSYKLGAARSVFVVCKNAAVPKSLERIVTATDLSTAPPSHVPAMSRASTRTGLGRGEMIDDNGR